MPQKGEHSHWRRYVLPFTVNKQGANSYALRAHDVFGHVTKKGKFVVKLDTRRPPIKSLGRATGRHRGSMTFRFKIVDAPPGSPRANATIDISTLKGKSKCRAMFRNRRVSRPLTCRDLSLLQAGSYRIAVSVTNKAGNQQRHVVKGRLVVR
jgi:hypothetical protein